MIPNVFVSSTIEDLLHLRDAVRDSIAALGYNPILSEQGGVGYLPTASAVESCLITLRQCQLAVLIVGKRYGSLGPDGISITHSEFRAARSQHIPIFCLIDREVITFKRVFDATTKKKGLTFPGMDKPEATFVLIQEFMDSLSNNGIISFNTASDASNNLKIQLAHFFGDMLRQSFNPMADDVKDVLAEVKALRQQLGGSPAKRKKQTQLARAIRLLFGSRLGLFKDLIESLAGSLEDGVASVAEEADFDSWIKKLTGGPIIVDNNSKTYSQERTKYGEWRTRAESMPSEEFSEPDSSHLVYLITRDNRLVMNTAAMTTYRNMYLALWSVAAGKDTKQV